MARNTLPILFLNLSGEMIYILDQRLRAQQVSIEKSKKVLNDIVGIMLSQKFLEELFKPQEVYDKDALRSVFCDLAHASIMRLNEESMCKLYDLMRMVFKYQVFAASQPKDLLLITLNHLDALRDLVTSTAIQKQLDSTYFLLIKTYGQMGCGELQRLRYHILNFFQDMRIRISILMRQKLQDNSGSFIIARNFTIPFRNEVPGCIRVYGHDGCVEDLLHFTTGGEYTQTTEVGSTEMRGLRYTHLGTNVYSSTSRTECEGWDRCEAEDSAESANYRQELNLLVKQLLGSQPQSTHDAIKLDLFYEHDVNKMESGTANGQSMEYTIAEPVHTESLHRVMTEMSICGPSNDQSTNINVVDLLDKFL